MEWFLAFLGIAGLSVFFFFSGIALVGGTVWAVSAYLSREERARYGAGKVSWPHAGGVSSGPPKTALSAATFAGQRRVPLRAASARRKIAA